MPIKQKLPPPVLLFSDFSGWVWPNNISNPELLRLSGESDIVKVDKRKKMEMNWTQAPERRQSNHKTTDVLECRREKEKGATKRYMETVG